MHFNILYLWGKHSIPPQYDVPAASHWFPARVANLINPIAGNVRTALFTLDHNHHV